jgi:hypothetical protein
MFVLSLQQTSGPRSQLGFSYFVHCSVVEDVNERTKHRTLRNILLQWGEDEETSLTLTDCFFCTSRYKENQASTSDGDSKLNQGVIYEDVLVNRVKDRAVIKDPG